MEATGPEYTPCFAELLQFLIDPVDRRTDDSSRLLRRDVVPVKPQAPDLREALAPSGDLGISRDVCGNGARRRLALKTSVRVEFIDDFLKTDPTDIHFLP